MRTVLVVDDDASLHQLITAILQIIGDLKIETAYNGREALEKAKQHQPDLIITDISMPWMTGMQVMHSVRTAGLPVPVVVMTALQGAEIADLVDALGNYARLIRKPFSFEELMAAINAVEHAA